MEPKAKPRPKLHWFAKILLAIVSSCALWFGGMFVLFFTFFSMGQRWILSPQGQALVKQAGYVPLHPFPEDA